MLRLIIWVILFALVYAVVRVAIFLLKAILSGAAQGVDSVLASGGGARLELQLQQSRTKAETATPNRRRWALAVGDILVLRNGLPCDSETLSHELPADQRQRLAGQVLREMDMPADLPAREIATRMQAALIDWVSGLGRPNEGFYEQLAAQGKVRDALALDCARTAFLVRCIALLGWVPESQAWLILFLNAQRTQDSFESWEDFGLAYARAREHWLRTSDANGATSARAALEVNERLQNPTSNWLTLSWNRYRIFDPQPVPA